MKYLTEFLKLRCAPDILGVSGSLGANPAKEISEGMSIRAVLKPIVLRDPMYYSMVEFCAGNALPSLCAVFTLPIQTACAFDKKPRERKWHQVKRFHYYTKDIYELSPKYLSDTDIIIAMHPCAGLALRIVEIYNESKAKHLILCPCCVGGVPSSIQNKLEYLGLSKDDLWVQHLAGLCRGNVKVQKDLHNLSARNIIITASK
jgi:hypothetical protein